MQQIKLIAEVIFENDNEILLLKQRSSNGINCKVSSEECDMHENCNICRTRYE